VDLARRRATYEDLLALPEGVRAELIGGEIVVQPAPLPKHLKPQGALRRSIGGPFDDDHGADGPGGWYIFIEAEVRFGAEVVRPDLSGWRRERLKNPNQRPFDVVPDWTCEVISPSTASRDRVYKRRLYAKHGVAFYWIVDPQARTLEALESNHGVWVDAGTFDDTAVTRIRPFEAVEIAVGRLFLEREPDEELEG
jgi:Uma2 family endonuclease